MREFDKALDEAVRPKPREATYANVPNACTDIRVVFGKESFFPMKYQGFDVGPVEVSIKLNHGETPREAYARAREIAEEFFLNEFEHKCAGFADRVKKAREVAGE